jgi:hypothetical protein
MKGQLFGERRGVGLWFQQFEAGCRIEFAGGGGVEPLKENEFHVCCRGNPLVRVGWPTEVDGDCPLLARTCLPACADRIDSEIEDCGGHRVSGLFRADSNSYCLQASSFVGHVVPAFHAGL